MIWQASQELLEVGRVDTTFRRPRALVRMYNRDRFIDLLYIRDKPL